MCRVSMYIEMRFSYGQLKTGYDTVSSIRFAFLGVNGKEVRTGGRTGVKGR
jgi:hypothetical protein